MLPAQARHWLTCSTRHATIHPIVTRTFHRLHCTASANAQAAPPLTLISACPSATQLLAHYFASTLRQGDTYLLFGDVGSGKSYFSRAFIRAAVQDENLPVPSPTFLLQNIYDTPQGIPIHHFDLYRLTDIKDLQRLDLNTSFSTAVSLLEWPSILGAHTPKNHLEMRISIISAAEQSKLSKIHALGGQDGIWDLEALVDSESDGDDEGSGDARWRKIDVIGHGQYWNKRVAQLQPHIAAIGAQFGSFVLSSPPSALPP